MKNNQERISSINGKIKAKNKRRSIIIASVACSLCFVFTLVCSLPILGQDAPSINAYKNDAYYPVIQKLNTVSNGNYPSKYSIFNALTWAISRKNTGDLEGLGGMSGILHPTAYPPFVDAETNTSQTPTQNPTSSQDPSNSHEETTLNQVKGVAEGDLLKRSTTHAFYLKYVFYADNGNPDVDKNNLPCLAIDVYELNKGDTNRVSIHYIYPEEGSFDGYWDSATEMFMSEDASTLTVFANCYNNGRCYTCVISLDISDVTNVTEINRVYVSGSYLSARKVNGRLLVATNFGVPYDVGFDDKDAYIPGCGNLGESYLSMDEIYVPQRVTNRNYTVLAMLDEKTLDVTSKYALLSFSKDMYVSQNNVYVMRSCTNYYNKDFDYGNEIENKIYTSAVSVSVTEIVALSYGDGFVNKGCLGVDGYVLDRYSLDEKDGILRVVATVNHTKVIADGNSLLNVPQSSTGTNASLYCYDLATLKLVASAERFAVNGEEVKSTRFDGDIAYVCTAVRRTDPVFALDLSDLNNIVIKDTGTIPGFSISLVPFGDKLIGIGVGGGSNSDLKIEAYKQTDSEVVSVGVYEQAMCYYSSKYKAHFVDAEHQLVGLELVDYNYIIQDLSQKTERNHYLLLHYDEATNSFEKVAYIAFDTGVDWARAFYKDDGVYVFGNNGCRFVDLMQ